MGVSGRLSLLGKMSDAETHGHECPQHDNGSSIVAVVVMSLGVIGTTVVVVVVVATSATRSSCVV